MMQFNINYLTNYFYKGRNISKKTMEENITNFNIAIKRVQHKFISIHVRKAFAKIHMRRKTRFEKIVFIERIINHKLQDAFYLIKRNMNINKKKINKVEQKHNYPLAIINRIISNKVIKHKAYSLQILDRNRLSLQKISIHLLSILKIHQQYIKRNFKAQVFRALVGFLRRKTQYNNHVNSLQYILDCIRVRIMFFAFSQMSVRTVVKNIIQLEKERGKLREKSRNQYIKKGGVQSQLKRKIHNIMGKINEQRINNNSFKINKARQNGLKLTKLNERLRIVQNKVDYELYELQRMKKEYERKKMTSKNRKINYSSQQIKILYDNIVAHAQQQNSITLVNKLIPKQKIKIFQDSLLFIIQQNIRLKNLICFYEKTGSTKSDSYINSQNENTYLREIINSLIYHILNSHQRQSIIEISIIVNQQTKQMKGQLQNLKTSLK